MPIKKFLYTIDVKKVLEDNNIFLEADNKNIIQKDNRPYYVSVKFCMVSFFPRKSFERVILQFG